MAGTTTTTNTTTSRGRPRKKQNFPIGDTINEFKLWIKGEHKSENTIKGYIFDLKDFLGYLAENIEGGSLPIANERLSVVAAHFPTLVPQYADRLQNNPDVAVQTYNRRIIALRRYLNFLAVDLYLDEDYSQGLKTRKTQGNGQHTVRWIGEAEVKSILESIPELPKASPLTNARNRAIIMVLVNCGLRVGELTELRVSDIDFEWGIVKVRIGKGNKYREVPIGEKTLAAVVDWLAFREEILSTDYLFISERSPKFSPRGIQHITKNLSEITGIDFSPHVLRHTFGKNVTNKTGQLQVTAQLLGHNNINTTRIYTTPGMGEMKKIINETELN